MRRERGMGLIELVLMIAAGVFVTVIGFKMVPVYLEFFAIKRALVATMQAPETKSASIGEIRKALARRFEVDNIKVVTPADVDISKESGNPVLSVSYAEKIPLFANVSACIELAATSAP